MNFKMQGKDFELLAKFIEKKAKGSELRFVTSRDQILEIHVTLMTGEVAVLSFFTEELNSFPKITLSKNLGDEL